MYDIERINIKIEDIEKYFIELENMKIKTIKDLDTIKFYASSMVIFSVVNDVIDLGDIILTEQKLGFPSEYKMIFDLLCNAKIIDDEMKKRLKDLVMSEIENHIIYYVVVSQSLLFSISEHPNRENPHKKGFSGPQKSNKRQEDFCGNPTNKPHLLRLQKLMFLIVLKNQWFLTCGKQEGFFDFRNKIAHRYEIIKKEDILDALKNLNTVYS